MLVLPRVRPGPYVPACAPVLDRISSKRFFWKSFDTECRGSGDIPPPPVPPNPAMAWLARSSQSCCTQQAKAALDTARSQVADLLGCNPDEVIFTSGGSESANYAIRGLCAL